MLDKIISFSIRNKLIIGIFIISLIGVGVYELKRLPIDAVPDITDNQVQIITVAPSLGAPDVERLITFPLEQVNSNIPGLKGQRSFSSFGLSVVTLVFTDETDIYWARQQISERLQQVQDQIPKEFGSPALAPVTTGLGEIYQYTVRPEKGYEHKYSASDLRTIQDWIVRRQLLSVKGVAEVSSFGGLLKQYEVAVVPEKLLAYNITIADVFSALEKNNQNTGGAYIEKNETALFIRSEGLAGTTEDIKKIVVKNLPSGIPLLVGNVAEVRIGNAMRFGAMTYNGEEQVSGAVVMMLKGANSKEVIDNIRERIEQVKTMLPEGIVVDAFLDRTKMVNNAISTVSKNLLEGALIVVFVLVLFLGNFRAGILVASVIPLSMLFAIILMNFFNVSGNLMSLGALDFGLIVDGAVIIVEAVMHRLMHSKKFAAVNKLSQQQMDDEVRGSASKMMNSAVFGQIIILVVYLPIFTLQGIEGKMFKPMAQTVAFALTGAFILSLTYIPMMSTLLLSKKVSHKENLSDRIISHLQRIFQAALIRVIRMQKQLIVVMLLLFGVAIFLLVRLGGEFIPVLPEGDFAVETRVLPGSNINTSIDAVSRASKILLGKFPEIEQIVAKTGSSEIPTDPMPMDASDLMIILKDRDSWTSATTYTELESKMSEALKAVPGVKFGFQYPVAMRFNELISGARQDVVCKIFGDDLQILASLAKQLGGICNSVEGSTGLYIESVGGMPQIVINYNRSALAQYGVNISDVNKIIKTAFAGEKTGIVYEGDRRFDLMVRLSGEKRKHIEDVRNLLIPAGSGAQIPLSALAGIDVTEGPNQIQRENSQRRIMVGFNVRGRDVQSMVHELQDKVRQQIKLPDGYYIRYGGAFENLEDARDRLYVAVPVSLALIFLLLYFAFHSVKLGLLIYSAIPLSAMGGIFALAVRGIPFSVSAGVGFIALFGVAVLNGIVLIAEFRRLKESGYTNVLRVVLKGTRIRLRPVLMTAFVASLGFLPMALSTGEGAEVQRPLATVVIGGLLIATFLTLFVLPVLYIIFNGSKVKLKNVSVMLSLVMLLPFSEAAAQNEISLKSAIDLAIKNNLQVKNELLKSELQKKLRAGAVDLPKTALSGQFGQYNSVYTDNEAAISQSMSFPLVYVKQRALQSEVYKGALLNVELKEAELRKEVSNVFYFLLYIAEKRKILMQTDSLYNNFLERSKLRFEKGESNILEKVSAESQRGQIAIQLSQVKNDEALMLLRFQLLLNSETKYVPALENIKFEFKPDLSSVGIKEHPILKILNQEKQISRTNVSLQRSKLFPDLNFAFASTTIRGYGADNLFYSEKSRFNYFQFGIGAPLFFKATSSQIASAKIQNQISENNYSYGEKMIDAEYQSALKNYQVQLQNVLYYEKTALPDARLIRDAANKRFTSGEINYLEWIMLNNNATHVFSNYAETIRELNQSAIQLDYLINGTKK